MKKQNAAATTFVETYILATMGLVGQWIVFAAAVFISDMPGMRVNSSRLRVTAPI